MAKKVENSKANIKLSEVDPLKFVEIWQQSDSLEAVAETLAADKDACQRRAHYMRKRGVPLKVMSARGRFGTIDYKELAKRAAELAPDGAKVKVADVVKRQQEIDAKRKEKTNEWQRDHRKQLKKGAKKPAKRSVAELKRQEESFARGGKAAQAKSA